LRNEPEIAREPWYESESARLREPKYTNEPPSLREPSQRSESKKIVSTKVTERH
jgi:hypothetical protein